MVERIGLLAQAATTEARQRLQVAADRGHRFVCGADGVCDSSVIIPDRAQRVILVADDEREWVDLVRSVLVSAGKPSLGLTSLKDVALALASGGVELLMIDWRWRDGAPLHVWEMARSAGVPVIVVTGDVLQPTIPKEAEVYSKADRPALFRRLGVSYP